MCFSKASKPEMKQPTSVHETAEGCEPGVVDSCTLNTFADDLVSIILGYDEKFGRASASINMNNIAAVGPGGD